MSEEKQQEATTDKEGTTPTSDDSAQAEQATSEVKSATDAPADAAKTAPEATEAAPEGRGRGARSGGQRGGGNERRNPRRPRRNSRRDERARPEFDQKLVSIRRVTRVMAGGRRFSFSVSMVIGDK